MPLALSPTVLLDLLGGMLPYNGLHPISFINLHNNSFLTLSQALCYIWQHKNLGYGTPAWRHRQANGNQFPPAPIPPHNIGAIIEAGTPGIRKALSYLLSEQTPSSHMRTVGAANIKDQ